MRTIDDDSVIFKDDNGDLVVSVEGYLNLKQACDSAPIELVIGDGILDFDNEYFVFI